MDRRYLALGCEYVAFDILTGSAYMPMYVAGFIRQNILVTALMLIYNADAYDCTAEEIATLLFLEAQYQRDLAKKETK